MIALDTNALARYFVVSSDGPRKSKTLRQKLLESGKSLFVQQSRCFWGRVGTVGGDLQKPCHGSVVMVLPRFGWPCPMSTPEHRCPAWSWLPPQVCAMAMALPMPCTMRPPPLHQPSHV
ncbi:MAG: hypothetical protein IPH54_03210 [Rhodoferax sp.]|nr:hypothetical protein [Rhodoferax sp.]